MAPRRGKTALSKIFQVCSVLDFESIDPTRINRDTKVADIDSLYFYINEKRPTYVKDIQSDKAASEPHFVRSNLS